MFCQKCGAEIKENAKFCMQCGSPVEDGIIITSTNVSENATENTPEEFMHDEVKYFSEKNANETLGKLKGKLSAFAGKIKALPKMVQIGGAVVIVLLIVLICVMVNSSNTINLNKYVVFETAGYEGHGTASVTLDWDAIRAKYGDKLEYSANAYAQYGEMLDYATPISLLEMSVDVDLDKTNQLSNGDKVNLVWDVPEELHLIGLTKEIKYKPESYKISGLEEATTIDVFKDLDVEFTGVDSEGELILTYNGTELSEGDFECSKMSGLKVGDKVTITFNEGSAERYAEENGIVPETLKKEYVVKNLGRYVTDVKQIDENALKEMKQQAKDVFDSEVVSDFDEDEVLESFTYLGNYLLTSKSDDSYYDHNRLYLVFKAQIHNTSTGNSGSYDKINNIYWCIEFTDLVVGADKKVEVDVMSYSTPNDTVYIDPDNVSGYWYYDGYETINDLYNNLIMENASGYNHQDNM